MAPKRQIVYFHGMPGSSHELDFLGTLNSESISLFAPTRKFRKDDKTLEQFFERLAREIEQHFPTGKVDLIGFSLGTYIALQVAPYLIHRVGSLHLVSVAVPLHWSNYLPDMAGKVVFELALNPSWKFAILLKMQIFLAKNFPKLMFMALFSGAQGKDKLLVQNPTFSDLISKILSECVGQKNSTYQLEIMGYVSNWQIDRALSQKKITLWHGSEDNWSPIEMARDFREHFGGDTELKELSGFSHYSTVYHALNEIFRNTD